MKGFSKTFHKIFTKKGRGISQNPYFASLLFCWYRFYLSPLQYTSLKLQISMAAKQMPLSVPT